ncbi:amino acid adenylation domain-containing protein [Kitasatospora sp. NPDC057512]|uniref:amino acid adenylation domain-containing protein n=1 Tax=Kitasatospora sp. NPDC057512 TaxID=3346154 RepID=UPI0036CD33C2
MPGEGIGLRIPNRATAPELPVAPHPAAGPAQAASTAHRGRVGRAAWTTVRREAERRGLAPAAVLITAWADVLRQWAPRADFTLDLVLPGRATELPLAFDALPDDSFAARAQRLQHQLDEARAGEPVPEPGERERCRPIWKATEEAGELVLTWDVREEPLPDGLPADLLSACAAAFDRLAAEDGAWDSRARLTTLPAWQSAERAAANSTAADLPVTTLGRLVEDRAAERPDAVAVIADDGQSTYGEVVADARRLARRLTALDATPGSLVGVVVERSRAQVPAVLGVTLSGAAYLPIDPQWPAARRAQVMEQGGVRTVVTTPRLRDELAWPTGVRLVTPDDAEVREADAGPLPTGPAPEDLAYVIFTSGSTGRPKGVVIDHRGAANTVQDINRRFGVGPDDRVLALSSLSFDLSVYDVFGTLAAGATVVVPAPGRAHDPEHWSALVERHGVTVWNSVPALMRVWLDAPVPAAAPAPAPSTVRVVLLSGDWIPVSLPDAVRAAHPGAQVVSLGGATEASIWSVGYPIGEVPPHWSRIPYGKPLANQTLHVLDGRLDPCPVWTTGEIHIGGTGVAKGYWADPVRTGERFIVHPVTGEYLYRTGDLGRYLPGGDIEFLGREDTQVKLNGYRIELDEIAAVLRRRPGVGEALLTVDTNPATDRRQLVAYVLPEERTEPAATPDDGAAWSAASAAGEAELRQAVGELAPAIATFEHLWQRLEALAPSVMARSLARLGAFTTGDATATADEITARNGLRPAYRGLVAQWLAVLAAEGLLSATGEPGRYRAERPFDADALDRRIAAELAGFTVSGPDRVLLDYFTDCVEQQVPMLQGRVRPLRLLLPDGDWRVTEALYAANPAARLQNRIAASAVRSFVERFPADRKVRILELGAGTGSTSDAILPVLPADRVRYRFTDLSTAFTTSARRRYEDGYPFVDYGLFDIDGEPAAQGLAPGSADVIVAANVLHDAKDLGRTLDTVRGLLAPGGLLVLIEGTVNSPLNMISFAFLEGFGNYQDQRGATLLSVPEWQEQLAAVGFTRFAAVPDGGPAVRALAQHVLVAGSPSGREALDPAALAKVLGDLLPEYMVPHHYVVLDRLPLSANGKVDRSALPSPWRERAPEDRAAPRTALQRLLLEMWTDALGRDDFGVEDNFFDLGGDSLHAVRVIGRLRTELGIRQSGDEAVDLLFQAPTIAELAAVLDARPEAAR